MSPPCLLGSGRREEDSLALRRGEPALRALEAFLEAAVVLLSLANEEDCRRVQGWDTGRSERTWRGGGTRTEAEQGRGRPAEPGPSASGRWEGAEGLRE